MKTSDVLTSTRKPSSISIGTPTITKNATPASNTRLFIIEYLLKAAVREVPATVSNTRYLRIEYLLNAAVADVQAMLDEGLGSAGFTSGACQASTIPAPSPKTKPPTPQVSTVPNVENVKKGEMDKWRGGTKDEEIEDRSDKISVEWQSKPPSDAGAGKMLKKKRSRPRGT